MICIVIYCVAVKSLIKLMGKASGCPLVMHILALIILCDSVTSVRAGDAADMSAQIDKLLETNKYTEAITLASHSLKTAEQRHGPNSLEVAVALVELAGVYVERNRHGPPLTPKTFFLFEDNVGPLLRRVLAIRERVQGPDHVDVASTLQMLAEIETHTVRDDEQERMLERALAILEKAKGSNDLALAPLLEALSERYDRVGRTNDGLVFFNRALELRENIKGADSLSVAKALVKRAELQQRQDRHAEAEMLLYRALRVRQITHGWRDSSTRAVFKLLIKSKDILGRTKEADALIEDALSQMQRDVAIKRSTLLRELTWAAERYVANDRFSEAETHLIRVFQLRLEPEEGVKNAQRAACNLAGLYWIQGDYKNAEPLLTAALGSTDLDDDEGKRVINQYLTPALQTYYRLGRHANIKQLVINALSKEEKNKKGVPSIWLYLLAKSYQHQNLNIEAEKAFKLAIERSIRDDGKDKYGTRALYYSLALLYVQMEDYPATIAASITSIEPGLENDLSFKLASGQWSKDEEKGLAGTARWATRLREHYHLFLWLTSKWAPEYGESAFTFAQYMLWSDASVGLERMTTRFAAREDKTRQLIRELQDLSEAQSRKMRERLKDQNSEVRQANFFSGKLCSRITDFDLTLDTPPALYETVSAGIDEGQWIAAHEDQMRKTTEVITEFQQRDEIIERLKKALPAKFTDLTAWKPVTTEELRKKIITKDEALILLAYLPKTTQFQEDLFAFVITHDNAAWHRVDLKGESLVNIVQALRCGLDATAWEKNGGRDKCAELLNLPIDKALKDGDSLPFDLSRAHALYKSLFGQVEDLIKGKSLIIVPSGPLTQLPFQVLVTQPPASGDYKSAAWLGVEHPLMVLPAVSSLKALRGVARPSAAKRIMIGFGNPLLDGLPEDDKMGAYLKVQAQLAIDNQRCPFKGPVQVASRSQGGPALTTRGGLAKLPELNALDPLPETADELCAVARDLNADINEVRLGGRATETEIKRLSALTGEERLSNYQVIHFATHGLLSGELLSSNEAGLVLTPPQTATEEDDGYLSASEVAALKLDADWVILSACNTAGGDKTSAEALSGLARAFFYAGARALLVSHWQVDSDVTVAIITKAFATMRADPTIGRADALRRAMAQLIAEGGSNAHPANWAPFVVVGEGAQAK